MRKRIGILLLLLLLLGITVSTYLWFKDNLPRDHLILYGNVDVRQVDLGFRVNGRVEEMPFQEGDFVARGTLMGTIDHQPYLDQVEEAKANLDSIKRSLENAEINLKRREELVGEGGVSNEDYQNFLSNRDVLRANLKQAEAALGVALSNLRYTEVFAPADGTILTRIREPGTVVKEGDPIYTLSLISPIWVRAFVSERDLGLIYPDMRAEVHTDTPGGKVYHGHIGFISPVAEFTPKTVETTQLRTDLVYRLRIIAENPDAGLKQGMPVTVKLPLTTQVDGDKSE